MIGQKVHSIPRPEETSSSFPLLCLSRSGFLSRQSHLSDSGLFVPFERSRNSRPHAPTLPFPRTFPASSLRSEAAEPPSLDEAFNMQSPWVPLPFVFTRKDDGTALHRTGVRARPDPPTEFQIALIADYTPECYHLTGMIDVMRTTLQGWWHWWPRSRVESLSRA